jgi:hypothetical protein
VWTGFIWLRILLNMDTVKKLGGGIFLEELSDY